MRILRSLSIVGMRSRKHCVVAGSWVVLLASFASAQERVVTAPATVQSPLRVAGAHVDDIATRLFLDLEAYRGIQGAEEARLTQFALSADRIVDLQLSRVDVFTADAAVVLGTSEGDVPLPRPDVVVLSGKVVGHPDSLAFVSLSPYGSNGLIRFAGETFIISSPPELPRGEAAVYNLTTLPPGAIQWSDFRCALDDLRAAGEGPVFSDEGDAAGTSAAPAETTARIAELAIETDWEFTALFGGNTDASAAYAATLIAATSEIYTRDLGTMLEIGYLRIWSDSNDLWSGSDTYAQLIQFRDYWRSNMGSVGRDVAHFLSGRGLGGGIAYMNALCSTSWGYAVSSGIGGYFPYPLQDNHSQNWDVFVVAHELGHNFGGPHTHDMNPRIDNCAGGDCSVTPNGTIMSYCHLCAGGMTNIVLHFHDRMINEKILPYLAGTTCVQAEGPPTIYQQPADVGTCEDYSTAISVFAGGSPPLSFEWRKDGVVVPGAVDDTLTIEQATAADAGVYDVTISNYLGSLTSDPATLTVLTCGPPDVARAGCRHLAITGQPAELTEPVAFHVSSPDYPCLSKYVEPDGSLRDTALFRPLNEWGTVNVGGSDIVPSVMYDVRIDYGSPGSPDLSDTATIVTGPWGDVAGGFVGGTWLPADGQTDFDDITALVDAFRNLPTAPPLAWGDIHPAEPDSIIDFDDISYCVDGFRGLPYPFEGPTPCP